MRWHIQFSIATAVAHCKVWWTPIPPRSQYVVSKYLEGNQSKRNCARNDELGLNFGRIHETTCCAIIGVIYTLNWTTCWDFLQQGKGLVKVNGQPLSLVQPEILRFKVRTIHSLNQFPRATKEGIRPNRKRQWQWENVHEIGFWQFMLEFLGLRAPPHRRRWQVRRCRHPCPRHRWWSHLAGLRHPSGYRQVHCRLLPEVRRWALQEPAEAGSCSVRPHTPGCRQPPCRAQEVRWSRCPLPLPEVLPLNFSFSLVTRRKGKEKFTATGKWNMSVFICFFYHDLFPWLLGGLGTWEDSGMFERFMFGLTALTWDQRTGLEEFGKMTSGCCSGALLICFSLALSCTAGKNT